MKKTDLFAILSGVFCAALIVSNIISFKTFEVLGFVLPTAVVIFPIVYITNDVLAEVFGYQKTKKVIWTGFAMNAIAVLAYNVAIVLPAPVFFAGQEAFALVLGNTFRALIASMAAYLIGSLCNAKIMEKMKGRSGLMMRCVTSTLVGEGLDALIFITIAFVGTMPMSSLAVMIIAQAAFKTLYEIVCYPVTRIVIGKVREME